MGKFGDTVPAKQSKREIFYKALKFFLHDGGWINIFCLQEDCDSPEEHREEGERPAESEDK